MIGEAASGPEALDAFKTVRPDVITMDLQMPRMHGLDVTRSIMETAPIPIVVVSASITASDMEKTFAIIEAGAVAAVQKPPGPASEKHDELARTLIRTVKDVCGVKLVRRWPKHSATHSQRPVGVAVAAAKFRYPIKVVALGASTGGPLVIHSILKDLPSNCPVPVLVVQHIADGFLHGMVDWLQRSLPLNISIASNGQQTEPGHVYFGEEGYQFGIDSELRLQVTKPPANQKFPCPSVSHLFKTLAEACAAQSIAVLLTGMGVDGARELKLLRDKGALTIAQDEQSSAVHGMPKEAIALGGAELVLSPTQISEVIKEELLRENHNKRMSTRKR